MRTPIVGDRAQLVAAALLPVLITLPRFWNEFVFDDVFVIVRGDFIHDVDNLPRAFTSHTMVASSLDAAVGRPMMDTYRPLSIATFFFDSALSGRTPWAYHLTNASLHAVVCALSLVLFRRLLGAASSLPVLLTLCFGMSPWLAEAHVFINGRSDVLLAIFVVVALLLQRAALEQSALRYSLVAGLSTFLALISKETAVLAIPLIALTPTTTAQGWRRRAGHAVPLLVGFLLYLALRANALGGLRAHNGEQRIWDALYNLPLLVADGLFHTLLPSPFVLRNLRDDYAGLPTWLPVVLGVTLWIAAASVGAFRRQTPSLAWSFSFGLATLAPATMITTELWPGFGRYLYLPALGFHAALGCALQAMIARRERLRRKATLALASVAVVAAACLVDATLALRSDEVMYARAVARAPDQAWAVGSLGMARKREGRCSEALPLLAAAARMAPSEPRYAVHLARCLLEQARPRAAYEEAARGRRRFQNTRAEAAFLIIQVIAQPHAPEARVALERCLQLDPRRADCREMLRRHTSGQPSTHDLRDPRAGGDAAIAGAAEGTSAPSSAGGTASSERLDGAARGGSR